MNNIEERYEDLQTILNSSKEFSFNNNTVLNIRQYYGKKEINLDLSKINFDMFVDLYYEPEKVKNSKEDYDL